MGAFLDQRSPSEEAREPILRSPLIVNLFILAFVAVHVGSVFLDDVSFNVFVENFSLIPQYFSAAPSAHWLPIEFSLLTYAFLHGDFVHLTVNVMWFLIFATAVARRVGTARFLGLMIVTTVGAALTHLAFYWGSPVPVVGVSGAVAGLMGSAFRFILPSPNSTSSWPPPALPLFSRPVMMMTVVWMALNIVLGVSGLTPDGFGYSIAWEAHLGGYFSGLLLFPLFDRRRSWLS